VLRVAEPRAKRFEHAVSILRDGRFSAEGQTIEVPDNWTPEHSVLAGLLDCSLTSLRYHALRYGIAVDADGSANGVVTKRASDGRYGFVDIQVRFDISLDPKPDEAQIAELLAKAERDCFVGASLTPAPSYTWNVA
jgi:uncharacterized OsmC-like protein